ncbi:MAG: hypothetical protein ACK4OP_01550 [Gemmobacter sp.]
METSDRMVETHSQLADLRRDLLIRCGMHTSVVLVGRCGGKGWWRATASLCAIQTSYEADCSFYSLVYALQDYAALAEQWLRKQQPMVGG